MCDISNNKSTSYFAAANGYSGFRSYFDSIFDSKRLERLFILKGGPGTGKSTLMKNIGKAFQNIANIESVRCSSDVNSLDGIIINANNKRCAVIDGTAPHAQETKIPGAFDEIINLSDGWDNSALIKRKEEIIELIERKSQYYSYAYGMLSLAGNIEKKIREIRKSFIDEDKARGLALQIFEKNPADNSPSQLTTRLYSCFGKDGYRNLNVFSENSIGFIGHYGTDEYLLECLFELYSQNNCIREIYPSVFDDLVKDGFSVSKYTFALYKTKNATDCDIILKETSREDVELLEGLIQSKSEFLKRAQNYFALASTEHFKLEDIYKTAVDFERNNALCEILCLRISRYLDI